MKYKLLLVFVFCHLFIRGQNTFQDIFYEFRHQAITEYEEFRKKVNQEYADFLRQVWEEYKQKPAIPKPKDENRPPVVMPEEDRKQPIDKKPITIEDVVTPPAPQPQPKPIAPIKEEPQPKEQTVVFMFYGAECRVRFPLNNSFRLGKCDKNALADAWETLSEADYNNTIRDCLAFRDEYGLCDWAYINMLKVMSEACLGKTNEAILLTAYIYCQSGYDMRIGISNGNVCMLYASRHMIYNMGYYTIGGKHYFPFGKIDGSLYICDASFPEEKPLDLTISKPMSLACAMTPERTIQSRTYPNMKVTVCTNKNLIDFFNTYPSSMINDDFITRWAMYANTPLDIMTKEKLYSSIRPCIEGMDAKETVEHLLNFVQTGFEYEYDDKVWGCDRAFFAEETLFYPYCDCEDRSILFSRMVRDLVGLSVVLVYYPRHLATAVRFNDDVPGDFLVVGNDRYVVCDPTYIGAPVGKTMPGMDNQTAKAIVLR